MMQENAQVAIRGTNNFWNRPIRRRVQMAMAPKVYPAPTQAALISGFISQAQYWAVSAGKRKSKGPKMEVKIASGVNAIRVNGIS
jgi:hypothetical protein